MKSSNSRQGRRKIFVWIVLGCVALAVGYTSRVLLRANAETIHAQVEAQAQGQVTPLSIAEQRELEAIQNQPHLVFLHQEVPDYGKLTLASLDPVLSKSVQTMFRCDRVYYAAGNGICLLYDTSTAPIGHLAPIPVEVMLFGSDLKPRHQFTVEGTPSRARISPDGKYAAFTVFVTGHSYGDANLSTATILLDTATGKNLGNLEEFETWKDGRLFQAPDFNFWGVTFARDSNRFYATLQHGNAIYLVQGDIAARKLTVLHEGIECPALSPDETRIAFKKRAPSIIPGMMPNWQLTVLDLTTMKETELAEKDSVDDQVEWLDNNHILYQKDDPDPSKWPSIFVVPADGTGQPEVLIPSATSPAVVR